ncbi:amidohydrolase family protein [bacterium]|nr:amidohydrolase family protein [bacterium]
MHVNIVPMTRETVLENYTVLVRAGRILEVGPADRVAVPEGARMIDGTDKYLLPGLADMHMHTYASWEEEYPVSPFLLFVANGVTTIRSLGHNDERSLDYTLAARDEIERGDRIGPALYTCGWMTGVSTNWDKDPVPYLLANRESGCDCEKLYSFLSLADYHKVVSFAHTLGLYVMGHIPYDVGLEGVAAYPMDEIAHIEELDWELWDVDRSVERSPREWTGYLFVDRMVKVPRSFDFDMERFVGAKEQQIVRMVKRVKESGCAVSTTVIIGKLIYEKLITPELFLARPELAYMPPRYLEAFARGKEKHQQIKKMIGEGNEALPLFKYEMEKMITARLHQAGVPLLLGTDTGSGSMGIVQGFSIHDELAIMVESGLSPYEALCTGTVNASRMISKITGKDDFGTVEAGKKADLVLVNGNPLQDVSYIKSNLGVMVNGRWFSREELDRMIALPESD